MGQDRESTRTMVLWCPDWPVRALALDGRLESDAPAAVVDRGAVLACSPAARREGVQRGQRVREAQARCSRLAVARYEPVFASRAFEPALAALERATPGVQPIRPGLVAIRARGPARFYGGEREAAWQLIRIMEACGIPDAAVGVADGPFAAEQAARVPEPVTIIPPGGAAGFLAPIPVAAFADRGIADLLPRLGVRTLGDLAAMDPHSLRERFGEVAVRMHSIASGADRAAVLPREPRKELAQRTAFEPGLDRVDQIAFAMRPAAEAFTAQLAASGLVCTAVTVAVREESGALHERVWLHPRWFTASDIVDRVRWQLQGSGAASGGPETPVVEVVLEPEQADALAHHESGLWGDGPSERIHHALSRIQSMLGHEAVLTACLGGGRLLRERQLLVPWGDPIPARAARDAAKPWPGALPEPFPATVFDPPLPAAVRDAAGGGIEIDRRGLLNADPAQFDVGGERHPATAWAGPWPLEQRWWDAGARRSLGRLHLVDDDGMAWLLFLERHAWWAEARYD